jgi:hypothetical protein
MTAWFRIWRIRVLALITVGATAWISFSSSQDLAIRAGFGLRAWAFPICLDAVAAFSTDIWMRRTAAQRAAGALALTSIGLSLASNVADHYLVAGTALAALLGGIAPAMLAWMLLVLHKHGQPGTSAKATEPVPDLPPAAPDPIYTGYQEQHPNLDQVHQRDRVAIQEWIDDQVQHMAAEAERNINQGMTMPQWWKHPYEDVRPPENDGEPVHTPPLTPVSTPLDLAKPLPVNVPDNDAERTQIMPRITDEQPGKFDPAAADPAPAKVQPARREAAEVSAPVERASHAHLSDEDLIQRATDEGLTSRRAIATAYGLGTNRAGNIARAVKEKSA